MEFQGLKRSYLPDEVIEQIKTFIFEGQLKSGDRLPSERELAQMFCVGRTTVREALKALDHVGLITRTKEGTNVAEGDFNHFITPLKQKMVFNSISFEELIESRKLLEVEMAGLAAERSTLQDLTLFKQNLKQTQMHIKLYNEREFIVYNMEFHELVARTSKNRLYHELIIAIRQLLWDIQRKVTRSPEVMHNYLISHQGIYKAIKDKDVARARELMLAHLIETGILHI